MRRQAGVVHPRDPLLLGAPLRHGEADLVLAPDTHRQGPHAAVDQPGGEGIDGLSPHLHQASHLVHDLIRSRNGAGDHVGVPVQILGRRVDHEIGPVLERPEIDGRRERGIDDERESFGFAERRDRLEIDHAHQRIRRRLEEDRARRLAHRALPRACLRRIYERDVDAQLPELFAEQPEHAAINPFACEQVIAGTQHRQVCERGRAHAARQEQRRLRALEQCQLLPDVYLVGIVAVPRVEDFGARADGIGECGALVERGGDCGPVGTRLGVAVNGAGGQS